MPVLLPLEQGVNFRDLGGYRTKDGYQIKANKVIRAASLGNLSPRDVNFLAEYGLRHDVDFRSSEEQENAPDKVPTGATYHFAPVFPEDETKSTAKDQRAKQFFTDPQAGFNNMLRAYHDIVLTDSAKKAYRHFFDVLLENSAEGRSVLFHCSAGKDRTGMGAIYLLTALGVDEATIKRDYLASNKYLAPWQEKQLAKRQLPKTGQEIYLTNLRALGSVDETYLDTAMEVMQREYGSLENYLHNELALTESQVADLKKIYLDRV